ncbi:ABC transporter substrate-binding protein [Johnsonella ignava]|uniref:ABC transporter substrate-binding protein n=1 Tax=Johnsonella ignava TaxID=43995 RepID=UPI0023F50D91|nr:ABC transporter substrate-binding protein [Johnsonella ignava]
MIKNFAKTIKAYTGFILTVSAMSLLVFLLSGCGENSGAASSQGSISDSEKGSNSNADPEKSGVNSQDKSKDKEENIDIVLDWYPNAVHAFLYEAQSKGYFADEGLKINIIFPSNASDPITMTAAGKADIGLYYQEDAIIAKANENIPVKVIGAVLQKPNAVITYLNETGIKSPADFKGKTIGYSSTGSTDAIMKQILKSANLTMNDVEMVDVGFDLMSSMTTKQVDATYGCVLNHEIPQLEDNGFDVGYIKPSEFGVPEFYGLIMVTSENNLQKNKDKYTRFIRACKKGFEDVKNNPDEAVNLIIDNQNDENFPLSKSVEDKSLNVLLPMMETDKAKFLSQNKDEWESAIKWMKESGVINEDFKAEEIMEELN